MADRKAWISHLAHLGPSGMARRFSEAASVTEIHPPIEPSSAILVTAEAAAAHLAEQKPVTAMETRNAQR